MRGDIPAAYVARAARRHIKKAVAASRLLQPMAKRVKRSIRQMKRAARLLTHGVAKSMRAAQRAGIAAVERPSPERYHEWRRRVKLVWHQVRLIEPHCAGRLTIDEKRLEALDGQLGEYHDSTLLARALIRRSPTSRYETARYLRLIRSDKARLAAQARRRARADARQVFGLRPARGALLATSPGAWNRPRFAFTSLRTGQRGRVGAFGHGI